MVLGLVPGRDGVDHHAAEGSAVSQRHASARHRHLIGHDQPRPPAPPSPLHCGANKTRRKSHYPWTRNGGQVNEPCGGLLAAGLFLPFARRLKKSVLVSSIANLFMTGLLFGLHFVTADSLVQPGLSRLGLNWLSPTFQVLGIVWGIVFFYLFGTEVDASQRTTESGQTITGLKLPRGPILR